MSLYNPIPSAVDSQDWPQSTKRVFGRLYRQHLAAASRHRSTMRVRIDTLTSELSLGRRTIHRALAHLKDVGLVTWNRTGRSSIFRLDLNMLEKIFGTSKVPKKTHPHKKPLNNQRTVQHGDQHGDNHVDKSKSIASKVEAKLRAIGYKHLVKGNRQPLTTDQLIGIFGASWILKYLQAIEDSKRIRNPPGYLRSLLNRSLEITQ